MNKTFDEALSHIFAASTLILLLWVGIVVVGWEFSSYSVPSRALILVAGYLALYRTGLLAVQTL